MLFRSLSNRGDKTDSESVDKKFLTNGYQRPILLGALIASGVDSTIAASFTSVGWEDIEAALNEPNAVEILTEKANLIAIKKEADKEARKTAAISLQTTAPAFMTSLMNVISDDIAVADQKTLASIYALLKDKLGK